MQPDDNTPAERAVAQLKTFGLSEYAARTFVALVGLGKATAQDVSDASEVPRTRVYDAVEELRGRGLVDVQQSTPKQFWAISTETAGRHFEQEYAHRVEVLTEALDDLGATPRTAEQRGVWTVTGRQAVTDRVVEFVASADDEVVFMTVEDLLTEPVVSELRAASDRGVTIRLGSISDGVAVTLDEAVPEAEPFETLWDWSDTPAGRLLLVDQQRTLASVLVPADGDHPPEPRDETAIWGSGPTNSLVVVLQAMFTWELDGGRE